MSGRHTRRPGKLTKSHVAFLAEILSRDGHRCAHCRAPGGATVLFSFMGPREIGSVSFRGKLRSEQASDYQKLYQTAEIKSRSAATRCTWMTRRRASETLWLM